MSETKKFHYDSSSGIIEVRPFFDDDSKVKEPYITLTYDEWINTISVCDLGYIWKAQNGLPVLCEHETDESIKQKKEQKISELKRYLSDTDYVISKLQECQLTGTAEEFSAMKAEYADILSKRKEVRIRLNELS